jgi:hypothetical protein
MGFTLYRSTITRRTLWRPVGFLKAFVPLSLRDDEFLPKDVTIFL